jgi:hypothetical protein
MIIRITYPKIKDILDMTFEEWKEKYMPVINHFTDFP